MVFHLRFSHRRSVLPDRNEAPKSAPQHVPTGGVNTKTTIYDKENIDNFTDWICVANNHF